MFTFDITGIEASIARVRELAKVSPEVKAATVEAGAGMQSEARDLAPVDTGTLVKSIQFRMAGDLAIVKVGAGYGAFVEFGTTRQRPQPYFTPAFVKTQQNYARALRKILADA